MEHHFVYTRRPSCNAKGSVAFSRSYPLAFGLAPQLLSSLCCCAFGLALAFHFADWGSLTARQLLQGVVPTKMWSSCDDFCYPCVLYAGLFGRTGSRLGSTRWPVREGGCVAPFPRCGVFDVFVAKMKSQVRLGSSGPLRISVAYARKRLFPACALVKQWP